MKTDPLPSDLLLEREAAWAALQQALADAGAGRGHCVVVHGETGIGKRALLDAWLDSPGLRQPAAVQVLRAGCEALNTPRPLGPFVDLSHRLPPTLGAALHAARTDNGLFAALLDWLQATKPLPLLVIEDLHWADEATLDGLRYLARRIGGVSALIVVSHRDDEPAADPALRRLLGALPPASTVRVPLAPLSAAAVAAWAARAGRPAEGLYRLTAGNPLFVAEVLAAAPGALPASVRDAVRARCAALPEAVRTLVERVSIAPGGLELELLRRLEPQATAALDAAAAHGLLQVRLPRVEFRHELARLAVEQSLPAGRCVALHGELLEVLESDAGGSGTLARRVHHAAAAGRSGTVLALAPAAAAQASRLSAHRAAAQLLRLALAHGDALRDAERASLLDDLGTACMLTSAAAEALSARREALQLRTRLGDRPGRAAGLTRLALMLTPQPEALGHAREALALAETLGEGATLAVALYALAVALTNTGAAAEALPLAHRSVEVAARCGDEGTHIEALNVCAAVELSLQWSPRALAMLERSVTLAVASGRSAKAGAGWVNLASVSLAHARHAELLAATAEGLDYCRAHDLDFAAASLRVRRALALVELGRWPAAEAEIDALRGAAAATARDQATAALMSARLATLCGHANDAAAWQRRLDEAAAGATEFLAADVAGYAAEAAWLRGDCAACAAAVRHALAAGEPSSPWLAGRLRLWLRRGGETVPPPPGDLPEPLAAALAGDWRRAAAAWRDLGCPYEAALAQLEGDETALRQALAVFRELGARPAADIARRALHALGARGVARGPYRQAAGHPHGLTAREQEVAALMAQGLGNADIARRLHRSERTVEHHVSAVLNKLGASTRAQATALLLSGRA